MLVDGLGVILVGDRNESDGIVISGSETDRIDGRALARKNDWVDCPARYDDGSEHGVNQIIEGRADTFVAGDEQALHGHRSECGCALISSFSPHLLAADRAAGVARLVVPKVSMCTSESSSAGQKKKYSMQFVLASPDGKPIVNYPYVMESASGQRLSGKTDADGCTQRLYSEQREVVKLHEVAAPKVDTSVLPSPSERVHDE